jgi:nucleotide-binding universal stress UspA family protein
VSTVVAAYKGAAAPDVLAFAQRLAVAGARRLEVVTVYPGGAPIGRGRVDGEWVAYNREQAELVLDGAREALSGVDATFRTVAAESAPRGLHDALEQAGPGSVAVVGSHGTGGVRRTAPGSTLERLMSGAPGPVVLVPWDYEEFAPPSLSRLAIAFVDTPDGLAAVGTGRAIATSLAASVELVTVLPDTRVRPSLGDPARFAAAQRDVFVAAIEDEAQAGEQVRLLDGPVVDALADLRPEDVDLLVCGSRGYGPARRVLLGGVSSRLLRHARVPVMVVPRP